VFDYAKEQGVVMTLLDIGGGFPGTDDGQLRFDEIAACVSPLLDELFPKSSGVRIIGEPGRYFCSGSSTLAVVVNSKRKKKLVVAAPEEQQAPAAAASEEAQFVVDDEMHDGDEDDFHDGEGEEDEDSHRRLGTSISAPELLDLAFNREGLPESRADDESNSQSEEDNSFRNPQAVVSKEFEFMYYLSDGVYGSFNNIVFDHAQPHPVLLNVGKADPAKSLLLYKSRLFGPTCDSIDVICDCVELPELEIGDWLLFPQMGAYTIAAASSFNGFAPPQSSYIMSWEEESDTTPTKK